MTVHGDASSHSETAGVSASRTAVDTAVILAAGEGSRLRTDSAPLPKPLVPLFGRTLLERAVLRSMHAGVRRVVVVLGYASDRLRPVLDGLERRLDVTIETVENPDWRAGNGLSALAAEPCLDANEPFFLMMCDHVFPADFFERLVEADRGTPCTVVAERNLEAVSDLDEAMKLATEDGQVCRIGKDLDIFDAVDTGVFLCRPALFDALRDAQAAGDDALCAGVQRLAERGEAGWVDSDGQFWQDIDTPEDLALARSALARQPAFDTDRYDELAGG
jgi:choline kinase